MFSVLVKKNRHHIIPYLPDISFGMVRIYMNIHTKCIYNYSAVVGSIKII